MYGLHIKYLGSVFVDAEAIRANTKDVSELMKLLKDEELLPIQFQELSASGMIQRIGFQSSDGKRSLFLLGKKFNYEYVTVGDEGSDLGDFSNFCKDAGNKLNLLLKYFGRKAHRLAAIQEGYLPEKNSEDIEIIANRLLKLPNTFSEKFPFEWDWRCAYLIERSFSNKLEPTNTIVKFRKRPKGPDNLSFGNIKVDLDINTTHFNTIARFGLKDVKKYFELSPSWHTTLSQEIDSYIKGI